MTINDATTRPHRSLQAVPPYPDHCEDPVYRYCEERSDAAISRGSDDAFGNGIAPLRS